ncbi:hypothetical protein BJ875DRAFT_509902 [Amylocarpus encephaloides]|uniref:Uncharacterized protein n=1 Tax=Amylocarpus encephaloides TaxID=45428 RepID=A0A9P8C549_9HELO|nr:hypothetical protein BJ875DRAFT_509902 [Amylocarpus encephaloides]
MTTARLPELNNAIVTSWLPLTTARQSPYPASCNSAFRLETLSGSVTNIIAYDPWFGQAIDTSARGCLAAEQTQWWAQEKMPTTVYNLGPFACPTPYTTATVSTVNARTTLVACCPNNYIFQDNILPPLSGRQCLSTLTSGQVIEARTGTVGNNTWSVTSATITATNVGVWGNQINGFIFGAEVLGVVAASTTAPGANATPFASTSIAGSISAIMTTGAIATPLPNSLFGKDEVLSTGAKVGIGVGVSVLIILACCSVFFLILRRRKAGKRPVHELAVEAAPTGRELKRKSLFLESAQELPTPMSPVEMWVDESKK